MQAQSRELRGQRTAALRGVRTQTEEDRRRKREDRMCHRRGRAALTIESGATRKREGKKEKSRRRAPPQERLNGFTHRDKLGFRNLGPECARVSGPQGDWKQKKTRKSSGPECAEVWPALRGIARILDDKVSQPLGLTSLVFGQAWRGVEILYCKRGSFQKKFCFLLYIFDNSAVERNKKGGSTLYI